MLVQQKKSDITGKITKPIISDVVSFFNLSVGQKILCEFRFFCDQISESGLC